MSTPEPKYAADDVREKYCPFLSRTQRQAEWVMCIGDACAAFRLKHSSSMDNPTRVSGMGKVTIKEIGVCGVARLP